MTKYYKKLLLVLFSLSVGFCLALALGSAEETSEPCQLCQNKALVKEAILALDEYPWWGNPPDLYDPNYVQHSLDMPSIWIPTPHPYGSFDGGMILKEPVTFDSIIAEGDMVSVCLSYSLDSIYSPWFDVIGMELATYRISGGKIVEGWVVRSENYIHPDHNPFVE